MEPGHAHIKRKAKIEKREKRAINKEKTQSVLLPLWTYHLRSTGGEAIKKGRTCWKKEEGPSRGWLLRRKTKKTGKIGPSDHHDQQRASKRKTQGLLQWGGGKHNRTVAGMNESIDRRRGNGKSP